MRVLLIDDDIRTSQAVTELLKKNRFGVDAVYSGKEGMKYALSGTHDLIILEKNLPDADGMTFVHRLRTENQSVPVMFLSSNSDDSDVIGALYAGADDYMVKPYNPDVLLARVFALTRRKGEFRNDVLKYKDFSLDINNCEIQNSDGESVKLSLKELLIITLLCENPHQVIRKEDIIERIWGGDSDAEFNNVEVYISFLRKKIDQLGVHVMIRTARGIGYSLEEVA